MFESEVANLHAVLEAMAAVGAAPRSMEILPPATEQEVVAVERELGVELPDDFRRVLLQFAAGLDFAWFAPRDVRYPKPFQSIFSGALSWSLPRLATIDAGRKGWVRECFPDPANAYDRVWHDKLAFADVGNGDCLALDLDPARRGRVVYLSHDDGEGHGFVMAQSFGDLIRRWAPLGCPGAEDWQWLPFTSGQESGIDPNCENGKRWRELLLGGQVA